MRNFTVPHRVPYCLPGLAAAVCALLLGLVTPAWSSRCRPCHDPEQLGGTVPHTPVAEERCGACHARHASRLPALLRAPLRGLCRSCHPVQVAVAVSALTTHVPAATGQCDACHHAHGGEQPHLLHEPVAALCQRCHEFTPGSATQVHAPYEQGRCSACHDAHGSPQFHLLRAAAGVLCTGCHGVGPRCVPDARPSAQVDCLQCHGGHDGEGAARVRAVQHGPFAAGLCDGCHGRPEQGNALCLRCHAEVKGSFVGAAGHLGVGADADTCLGCHRPHAAARAGLLPADLAAACAVCHEATFRRREEMLYHHPKWEQCLDCHAGHGGSHASLLRDGGIQTCTRCHERHQSFTHPVGPTAQDPRDGKEITCVTCHDPNSGTLFPHNLRGSSEGGLCRPCHPSH